MSAYNGAACAYDAPLPVSMPQRRRALGSVKQPENGGRSRSVPPSPSASMPPSEATLLAAASHDLRQPLQAIGLWIEILRSEMHDAHTSQVLAKISDTARGLESVLESLLDISRLDMRRVEAHLTDFDASELLERLAATFTPAAARKRLRLRIRPSSTTIHSDPSLLERLLSNLVANAIRYTERGGVLVGCRRQADALSIEVWDTGVGIPEDRLDDIFEEFVQLHRSSHVRDRGAGLGLSIARRVAAVLGLEIGVTSRVARGSCFRVVVPCVRTRNDEVRSPLDGTARLAPDVRGAFVVLIDDEPAIRDAVQGLLGHWGCHAVATASTGDALQALAGHLRLPDLLISDYRLTAPETGLDAIRALRAVLGASVPAVLISGEPCSKVAEAASADGIALLPKPISATALRTLIAQRGAMR